MSERELIVDTAQYWFHHAREAQKEGKMADALLFMENALNHTEGALANLIRRTLGKDSPTLEEFRQVVMEGIRDALKEREP